MRQDVLIGDVLTRYQIPTYDDDIAQANFDPSAASVKQIVFRMPQGAGVYRLLTRTATAEQVEIEGVDVWCLTYTVQAADVGEYVDANNGGFHVAAGDVSIEGHVEYASGAKWTSGTVTTDQQGRRLKVVARLAA